MTYALNFCQTALANCTRAQQQEGRVISQCFHCTFSKRENTWLPVGLPAMSVHATTRHDSSMVGPNTLSHHYGMTTCENIRPCDKLNGQNASDSEVAGSLCTKMQANGNALEGYCYTSSEGTLECGRAAYLRNRYASTPRQVATVMRCPAGTPLVTPGRVETRRLLIGGCMISSDAKYELTAEIHVPLMCEEPADYRLGCLFPGALNYLPGARQSGPCRYVIFGCIDSTALNFNSWASTDDGSCILPVKGCTLKTDSDYTSVDPATPMYQRRYVGMMKRGRVPLPSYQTVLNPNAMANVLDNCTVAIEGCTDPAAANYNSNANINTNTWCLPMVTGCMMPSGLLGLAAEVETGNRLHTRDGGSGNYNPAATIHNLTACTVGRTGCTLSLAVNYDRTATIDDGSCFARIEGCLDRSAMNFNCTRKVGFEPCYADDPIATIHAPVLCQYAYSPPPVAAPPFPPFTDTRLYVEVRFIAAGDVIDYSADRQASMRSAFSNVSGSEVFLAVSSASVQIVVQIEVVDEVEATGLTQSFAPQLASPEAATAFLSAAGVIVLSTPTIETKRFEVPSHSLVAPVSSGALISGIGGGAAVVILTIAIVGYYVRKRRRDGKVRPVDEVRYSAGGGLRSSTQTREQGMVEGMDGGGSTEPLPPCNTPSPPRIGSAGRKRVDGGDWVDPRMVMRGTEE